jgi:hypothetical protein
MEPAALRQTHSAGARKWADNNSSEGDGINDKQNEDRSRYGEQRSHVQKSTFND